MNDVTMNIPLDSARLDGELEQLAMFSATPAPSVTRVLWTPHDLEARAYLRHLFRDAGLSVREDAVGNIFARLEGREPDLPAVATGSHFDAIPHAGRFDGTVGVLGGLEALRALQTSGVRLRRSVELIAFTSEEPTRFGLGCLGSRALSGARDAESLRALKDADGLSLEEIRRDAGCQGDLENVRLHQDAYHAFVELHIEQGPELERAGLPIGIVSAIAAPAALRVELTGVGGHAGATLMPGRRDALLAGAELALAVEAAALSTGSRDTVATTGFFQVHPGAVNSVPSRLQIEIDARDIDLERRDSVITRIERDLTTICARRGIEWTLETLNADPPATCAPMVIQAIEASCDELKLQSQKMVSRAYHDALFMARGCPTGMIFISCKGGISHRPDEYASPQDIARGTAVLAQTLARLAQ